MSTAPPEQGDHARPSQPGNTVAPTTQLPGGRTVGAVRIGDTVRRPMRPFTPTVRSVLAHLERVGFDGAPRPLGVDGEGREMLSYLEGDTVGDRLPWPDWVWSDSALIQVAVWLRRLHDATSTFVPGPDAHWFAGQTWRPGLIIGHHDAAPYNAVWRDGTLIGFYDWDTAGPSSPELDLAFAALFWVPLHSRRLVEQAGYHAFGDRHRRLHLMLDAYRLDSDRYAFRSTVVRRARINADVIERLAQDGDATYTALLPSAVELRSAADEIESLPSTFWARDTRP